MHLKKLIPASAVAVAAATAALVSGCGAGTAIQQADLANGKTQFTQKCGGCHTLQDAGTKGLQGPNLDDAFRGSREQGFKESEFYGLVHRWIDLAPQPPAPGGNPVVMPRNLVSGTDQQDVAAYVARVAGTSPESVVRKLDPSIAGPAPAPYVWEGKGEAASGK